MFRKITIFIIVSIARTACPGNVDLFLKMHSKKFYSKYMSLKEEDKKDVQVYYEEAISDRSPKIPYLDNQNVNPFHKHYDIVGFCFYIDSMIAKYDNTPDFDTIVGVVKSGHTQLAQQKAAIEALMPYLTQRKKDGTLYQFALACSVVGKQVKYGQKAKENIILNPLLLKAEIHKEDSGPEKLPYIDVMCKEEMEFFWSDVIRANPLALEIMPEGEWEKLNSKWIRSAVHLNDPATLRHLFKAVINPDGTISLRLTNKEAMLSVKLLKFLKDKELIDDNSRDVKLQYFISMFEDMKKDIMENGKEDIKANIFTGKADIDAMLNVFSKLFDGQSSYSLALDGAMQGSV